MTFMLTALAVAVIFAIAGKAVINAVKEARD